MSEIQRAEKAVVTADELHARAAGLIQDSHRAVFSSLRHIIGRIIETKAWRARAIPFKTFGEYALSQTVDGLSVDSDDKLYLLRSAMDVHGKHMAEWGDVLAEVEKVVRIYAKEEGLAIRSFDGNSLESLAKNVDSSVRNAISYMPSRQKDIDGHLMRLRRADSSVYRKVVSGKMTVKEGRQAAGLKVQKVSNLGRAISAVKKMTDTERSEFMAWLKNSGIG